MKFCKKRENHVCLGAMDTKTYRHECDGNACVRERGIEAPYKAEPPQHISEHEWLGGMPGTKTPTTLPDGRRLETVEEVRADADKAARLRGETPAQVIEAEARGGNVLRLVRDATKSALPPDTGQRLRELADACDRGEIGSLVLAAERIDVYETHFPSSLTASCVLIQLLQMRWQQKMVE